MPIYTCTIAESTLSADTKRALAGEIARIHSSISFIDQPRAKHLCERRIPRAVSRRSLHRREASPVLVSGWVREGGVNTIDVPVDYSHNTNLSPSFMTASWSGAPGALSTGTIAGR